MQDDDASIAKRSLEMQKHARDIPLLDIPAYRSWSKRKLNEGVSEAIIAHLDATAMWLLPEEIATVTDDDFDELLEDWEQSTDAE